MFSALLWSIDGIFIRPSLYALNPGLLVFLEHLLGFIILSPFIYLGWKQIKNMTKKSWIAIIGVSLFGGLIGTIFITKAFFAAFHGETSLATIIILQKLQPFFALALAAILLKEKLPKNFYAWASLAIVSAYFLAFGKTGLDISSLNLLQSPALFALIAAVCFGTATVLGKRIVNHLDFKITAALRFGITSILGFLYTLISGTLIFSSINNKQWNLLILIVFSSGALAMFIYYYGLRRTTASTATIAELFWPFSGVIIDYIINKNVLSPIQIIFSIVLIISFYMVIKETRLKLKFTSKVVKGDGRGKKLGYPTANLENYDIDIPHGVYLAKVIIKKKSFSALLHFGYRETFKCKPSLELYIKDFDENIYDEEVDVEIIKKIRDVKKFCSPDELKAQIKKDLEFLNLKKK